MAREISEFRQELVSQPTFGASNGLVFSLWSSLVNAGLLSSGREEEKDIVKAYRENEVVAGLSLGFLFSGGVGEGERAQIEQKVIDFVRATGEDFRVVRNQFSESPSQSRVNYFPARVGTASVIFFEPRR